jgi:hypothetical protein
VRYNRDQRVLMTILKLLGFCALAAVLRRFVWS